MSMAGLRAELPEAMNSSAAVGGSRPLVLIVTNGRERRDSLVDYLFCSGLEVETVSLEQAAQSVAQRPPDAVLIFATLPDRRVSDLVRSMSKWGRAGAVTLLSDTGDLVERVLALEMDVDDFVSGHCAPREILARIHGLLRRSARLHLVRSLSAPPSDAASGRPWVLDERKRELVAPGGVSCELTPQGMDLINALIEQPDCLSTGGCSSEDGAARNLRTAICRLRKRFAQQGVEGFPIRNVHGVGYVLDAEIKRAGDLGL